MRTRMRGLLLLLGGIPLLGLLLAGTVRIERGHDRRIREAVTEARDLFTELDSNGVSQLSQFVQRVNSICRRPEFQAALQEPVLTRSHPVIAGCFKEMARAGIPLESIIVAQYRPGGQLQVIRPEFDKVNEDDPARLSFTTWLYGPLKIFSPSIQKGLLDGLSETTRLAFNAFGLILTANIGNDLALLRRRGVRLSNGDSEYFICFDFFSRDHRMSSGVVFRAEAAPAYFSFARRAIRREIRRRPGQVFGLVWLGRDHARFELPQTLKPRTREVFRRFLSRVAVSQADQEWGSGEIRILGSSCRQMKGHALMSVVDLGPHHRQARLEYGILGLAVMILSVMILLIGRTMAGYFLSPLVSILDGLRQILARRLDVRLNLDRADELGEVGARFDQMAQGLQERHELARFVSGALSANIEGSIETASAPQFRSVAILASDIRGFTTLSEHHAPPVIVEMLNTHLELMSEAVRKQGGQVDKFIGDAIIAAFVGEVPGDMVERAVAAGREMMRVHQALNRERADSGYHGNIFCESNADLCGFLR